MNVENKSEVQLDPIQIQNIDNKSDQLCETQNHKDTENTIVINYEIDPVLEQASPELDKHSSDKKSCQTESDIDSIHEDVSKKRLVQNTVDTEGNNSDASLSSLRKHKVQNSLIEPQRSVKRKRNPPQIAHISIPHQDKEGFIAVIGQGDAGQLGLGSGTLEALLPTKVNTKMKFKQVICGGLHTLALSYDGIVYSCGCNDEGALGRKATNDNDSFLTRVDLPKHCRIVKISAGDSHSAALSSDGKVYAWGAFRDTNGPVGLKSLDEILLKPTLIFDIKELCVDISSGSNHILILTESGRIFSCGTGDEGQLGRIPERRALSRGGRRGSIQLTIPEEVFLTKFQKGMNSTNTVLRIGTGSFNSFAQCQDGSVYGWGLNYHKQLGSDLGDRIYFPILLKNVTTTCFDGKSNCELKITGGIQHTMILNRDTNILYSMGSSYDGRLGVKQLSNHDNSSEEDNETFVYKVDLPLDISKIIDVQCGDACSFVLTDDNKVYSWGMGCNNQLGFEDSEDVLVPTIVPCEMLKANEIIQVSSGGQHTAILYVP